MAGGVVMTTSAVSVARRRYERDRSERMRRGTWRGLVDAEEARNHVMELRRIWRVGYTALAEGSQVSATSLVHLVEGSPHRQLPPPARITARLSDLILTITVDDLPDHAKVSATGTARRLQALTAAGWTLREIGDRASADLSGLRVIRCGEQERVSMGMARQIREVFEELNNLDPTLYLRKSAVSTSQKKAAANEWLPAKAWADAIDDPQVKPWETNRCSQTGCIRGAKDERLLCANHLGRLQERGTLEGLRVIRNSKVLIENAQFILTTDPPLKPNSNEIDVGRLAERLEVTTDALEKALERANLRLENLRKST